MGRTSARLKGHDYSEPGWYFVTLNTKGRECFFRQIDQGLMRPSRIGETAGTCWRELPAHFPYIELDDFALMPDHFHGIIRIVANQGRDVQLNIPTGDYYSRISPKRGSLALVVRTYKAAVTTICRQNGLGEFKWQRGYHDHIIHDPNSLARIRAIIASHASQGVENVTWLRNRTKYLRDIYPNLEEYVAGFVTSVEGEPEIPGEFALEQNYPNPFNPSTQVKFSIPNTGPVKLAIFDILGREIRTLHDGVLAAGRHTAIWDGRDRSGRAMPSGVYFNRLTHGDRHETRKVLLVR